MNDLKIFNYEGNEVRTVQKNGRYLVGTERRLCGAWHFKVPRYCGKARRRRKGDRSGWTPLVVAQDNDLSSMKAVFIM